MSMLWSRSRILDEIIDVIGTNCDPDEVFDEKILKEWIISNYTPGEIFLDKEIVEYIEKNFIPEQVFDENVLEQWALADGYQKGE